MYTEAINGLGDVKVGDTIFVQDRVDPLKIKSWQYRYLVTEVTPSGIGVLYNSLDDPITAAGTIDKTTFAVLRWGRVVDERPYDPSQEPDADDDV